MPLFEYVIVSIVNHSQACVIENHLQNKTFSSACTGNEALNKVLHILLQVYTEKLMHCIMYIWTAQ